MVYSTYYCVQYGVSYDVQSNSACSNHLYMSIGVYITEGKYVACPYIPHIWHNIPPILTPPGPITQHMTINVSTPPPTEQRSLPDSHGPILQFHVKIFDIACYFIVTCVSRRACSMETHNRSKHVSGIAARLHYNQELNAPGSIFCGQDPRFAQL